MDFVSVDKIHSFIYYNDKSNTRCGAYYTLALFQSNTCKHWLHKIFPSCKAV